MDISDSHFTYVPRFDSTGKFELYQHGWSSLRVDDESMYVESDIQEAEHLDW